MSCYDNSQKLSLTENENKATANEGLPFTLGGEVIPENNAKCRSLSAPCFEKVCPDFLHVILYFV